MLNFQYLLYLLITQIEPYACGKRGIDSIKLSIKVFGTDMSQIKASNDLVFLKIFQTLLVDNYKFQTNF